MRLSRGFRLAARDRLIATGKEVTRKSLSAQHAGRYFLPRQDHLVVTFTVALLFARFASVCGKTVWTEAVFTICCATLDAATVIVIVSWPNAPPFCRSMSGHTTA